MSKRQPKTEGLEWLIHSLMAFNGSGYADMYDADSFIDSYIAYKTIKKKLEAVRLAQMYRDTVFPTIQELLDKTLGASRQPSQKMLHRIHFQRNNTQLL